MLLDVALKRVEERLWRTPEAMGSEHEWVEWKYDGDAKAAIGKAIRNRHAHKRQDYKTARALIELAIEGAL